MRLPALRRSTAVIVQRCNRQYSQSYGPKRPETAFAGRTERTATRRREGSCLALVAAWGRRGDSYVGSARDDGDHDNEQGCRGSECRTSHPRHGNCGLATAGHVRGKLLARGRLGGAILDKAEATRRDFGRSLGMAFCFVARNSWKRAATCTRGSNRCRLPAARRPAVGDTWRRLGAAAASALVGNLTRITSVVPQSKAELRSLALGAIGATPDLW